MEHLFLGIITSWGGWGVGGAAIKVECVSLWRVCVLHQRRFIWGYVVWAVEGQSLGYVRICPPLLYRNLSRDCALGMANPVFCTPAHYRCFKGWFGLLLWFVVANQNVALV